MASKRGQQTRTTFRNDSAADVTIDGVGEVARGNDVLLGADDPMDDNATEDGNDGVENIIEKSWVKYEADPAANSRSVDDAFHAEIAETLALLPAVPLTYVWSVPGDREGYALRLLSLAKSVDEARWDVTENAEERIGRPLSATEINWVSTVEPDVVTPVSEISIDYNNALAQNVRLKAENEALYKTREVFESIGIDPLNPHAWVTSVEMRAGETVAVANAVRDERHKMACARIQRVLDELRGAQEELGFAPPLPQPEAEPDYSALTVVYPDERTMEIREAMFPRLRTANAVCRNPVEPMGTLEADGFRLMERVFDDWRYKGGGSENEQEARKAFTAYLRSILPTGTGNS